MAARRPHVKSRSGCADCKRRRVKCDENRPQCDNCRRRDQQCSFKVFDPASTSRVASLSAVEKAVSAVHVFAQKPDHASRDSLRQGLLDMSTQHALLANWPESEQTQLKHILQHFASHTIPTLTPHSEAQIAWTMALPLLAEKHAFVVHGMLAISALHLSSFCASQEEQEAYRNVAATQMNIGAASYRAAIQHVTTENAEALFAFSTTMTTFVLFTAGIEYEAALATLRAVVEAEQSACVPVMNMVQETCRIFRSIRGVLIILVPCWDHIQNGMLGPIVRRDWWPPPVPVTAQELDDDRKLRLLEKMWSQPGRTYEYSFDTLRNALKDLREAFALQSRLQSMAVSDTATEPKPFDWTSVMHWPVSSCSSGFITLLEQRRTEAWVLVAHYAMLPVKVKGICGLKVGLETSSQLPHSS